MLLHILIMSLRTALTFITQPKQIEGAMKMLYRKSESELEVEYSESVSLVDF